MSAEIAEKPVDQKVEELEDELPELEENEVSAADTPQSRGEKKARKAIKALGLKKVEGINRVTMRRPRGVLLVVAKPDVYRSVNSDTYIVFGESSVEDMNAQAQAAQALAGEAETEASEQTETAPAAEEEDDGEVDATGVDEKDIELVVSQANVSRNKAVKALKNNNNDIVNAIMVSDRQTIEFDHFCMYAN
ncbi:hypothetical protein INT43_000229 [Umbelopsis isabellina]|uniref:Nascent polypeptide-associated complex subunit alpha n=1 Tax=Mortierella isabellina TaxID=91625 RepID=A0A8H7PFU4_MORIS|nr:hypothetical protein INT43_000229 [Umbelopsis isabellina]